MNPIRFYLIVDKRFKIFDIGGNFQKQHDQTYWEDEN